jgi:hypothetical protein
MGQSQVAIARPQWVGRDVLHDHRFATVCGRPTAYGPTRVQYENKDPRGHAEFKRMLAEHSAIGSANTQQGVQKERPSLYTLAEEMKRIIVPTLIVTGDEDWPCLLPGILMKESIPRQRSR